MTMRGLGRVRGTPRPKAPEQWEALYQKHKFTIPNGELIKALQLTYCRSGPGNSGVRHFKYNKVPIFKRFYPHIEIRTNKITDPAAYEDPYVALAFEAGREEKIAAKGLREDEILQRITEAMNSRRMEE